jgi:hypothetical protein
MTSYEIVPTTPIDPGDPSDRARRIDELREEVSRHPGEVRGPVHDRMDWRTHVQRQPLATLAASAAAGVLLSLALHRIDRWRRRDRRSLDSGGVVETALKAAIAGAVLKTLPGSLLPRLVGLGTSMLVDRLGRRR